MSGRLPAVVVAVAGVAVASVALIAVVAAGGGGTAIVDLEPGDCFRLPDVDEGAEVDTIDDVDVIDCDEPHDAEVVLVGELDPDGEREYPTDAELFAEIDRRCAGAPGVPADEFGLLPIAPTADTWDSFGGRFACVAIPYGGGDVTGSLVAGSAGA